MQYNGLLGEVTMKKTIAAAILLVCSIALSADPSSGVRFLMNEPMTMFDWGMYRLQQKMDTIREHPRAEEVGLGGVIAMYDWEDNRIVLWGIVHVGFPFADTVEAAREQGRQIVETIRDKLGVKPDGTPIRQSSFLDEYFSHGAFVNQDRPKDLGAELDRITEITTSVTVVGRKDRVKCQAPLVGGEIMFTD